MDIITDQERLHIPCRPAVADDELVATSKLMFNELKVERDGLMPAALSANQLGYTFRMFVMLDKQKLPICMVNPEITKRWGGGVSGEEQCLSIPGVSVPIYRPAHIKVKFLNQYMVPRKLELSGFLARVVCHEIDHLRGKLITDYGPSTTGFSGQEDDGEL